MNTDASIHVYKLRPNRTGFNMYAMYTLLHLTFPALYITLYLPIYEFMLYIQISRFSFYPILSEELNVLYLYFILFPGPNDLYQSI